MGTSSSSYDRVFIMIGRAGAGKSTLGNFILGDKPFKELAGGMSSCSTTRDVSSKGTTLPHDTVLGMGFTGMNSIEIKVIDQPGMDDSNISLTKHCSNLIECLTAVDVKTFATFLIVINLNCRHLADDRGLLIIQLSEMLMRASYNLFSHAVVVFTHIDKLGCDINNTEELMNIVRRKCEIPGWRELTEIMEAVNGRCIFVNGTNYDTVIRYRLLKRLFEQSKSTLHMRFHGNNNFTSAYLKRKLDVLEEGIVEEEIYKLNYQFHPDINIFWMDEARDNLENEIQRAIQSMIDMEEGVSAMVILISLLYPLSEQMEKLIYDLHEYYVAEDDPEYGKKVKQFWNQTFIVFEISNEYNGKAIVSGNIKMNPRIKSLVEKVNDRWTWVTKDTHPKVCRDRITEMSLAVRKAIGGREFIQNTVIKELRGVLRETEELQRKHTEVIPFNSDIHKRFAAGAIGIIRSNNSKLLKLGMLPLKGKISIQSMRLILRGTRLNSREMGCFRAKYKNPQGKVSIEEVLHFLAQIPRDED